jgi:hypothetical protein
MKNPFLKKIGIKPQTSVVKDLSTDPKLPTL